MHIFSNSQTIETISEGCRCKGKILVWASGGCLMFECVNIERGLKWRRVCVCTLKVADTEEVMEKGSENRRRQGWCESAQSARQHDGA